MSKQEKTSSQRKLLEAWEAPPEAGQPVGCIATSFTFDSVFFEEECLGRFLQLTTDPEEDGPLYLIEREEKLYGTPCFALVDQHHAQGNRSLRWDLISVRPEKGVFHAKLAVLHWTNCIRLIVTSANITKDGYRKQQEILGVLDFYQGGHLPKQCLYAVNEFLQSIIPTITKRGPEPKSVTRLKLCLQRIISSLDNFTIEQGPSSFQIHPVLISKQSDTLFTQLRKLWPSDSPPDEAIVTSPFFSQSENDQPAKEIWKLLKQRGEARVFYDVIKEHHPDPKKVYLRAPSLLAKCKPAGRPNADVIFRTIEERDKETGESRALHRKSIFLENDRWSALCIGSSNFTAPGTGLGPIVNFEANLFYLIDRNREPKRFVDCFLDSLEEGVELAEGIEIEWQSLLDETSIDTNRIVLPDFFHEATFGIASSGAAFIRLFFSHESPRQWSIRSENSNDPLYDSQKWKSDGEPADKEMKWNYPHPPLSLEVSWKGSNGWAKWPISIETPSSLPAPEQLRNLDLDVLIDILVSSKSLHNAIKLWMRRKKNNANLKPLVTIDPHKKVDVSSYLLNRTRRISRAFSALRTRLEEPIATIELLEWRLNGPVGAKALKEAITREAASEFEKSFFLLEFFLELSRTLPRTAEGYLPSKEVSKKLQSFLVDLKQSIKTPYNSWPPSLARYAKSVFGDEQ